MLLPDLAHSRTLLAVVGPLALVASFTAAPVRAGTLPDVLILAAAGSNTGAIAYTDPQSRLLATGQFASVDVMNAGGVTPTLAQLQAYDAVLTWSNNDYSDEVALGDVLADYVDAGGGVVVSVFANSSTDPDRRLSGRWITGGYDVVVPMSGNTTGSATLGTIHVPSHPVLTGVSTFAGGTLSYRPTTTALTAGATRLADWSDGRTLAAEHGTLPNRVDLGFYPLSSTAISTSWDPNTDGALLMANALTYVANAQFNIPSYCFGDGTGAACPCANSGAAGNGCASSVNANGANLSGSGNPSIASDTLVLQGSGMPNSSALYFQGTTQIAVSFGDGLRCVGGAVIRLGTKSNTAGASTYPSGADQPVSVRGLCAAGDVRNYQCWYRNSAAFCTASTFNLTNGLTVVWGT